MVLSTIANPLPSDVAFNAPNFSIKVEGGEVPLGVRQLVQRVEYESTDGMADLLKVMVWDPDFIPPKGMSGSGGSGAGGRLNETKIFQPGNEIAVAFGYGTNLQHVGRAIIRKSRPNFPSNAVPMIEVVAYTKDVLMMDNAPEKSKKQKGKGGRAFVDKRYSEAVAERAEDYGFTLDIDETPDAPHRFMQKAGLTDYDFVNGLANLTGFVLWVEGDVAGIWTLHFKNPETLAAADIQDRKYTFRYSQGNLGSLLAFEPELAIQGSITKLKVQVKNTQTGRLMEAEFTEDNDQAPETLAEVSGDTLSVVDQVLDKEHTTGSDVKLFLDDYSFEVQANRRFTSEAEVIQWARQWYRRQRENFVLARGATIGVENLMARQTHALDGVGPSLSADYYFSRVKHILSDTTGYLCDFNCRKVVPPMP